MEEVNRKYQVEHIRYAGYDYLASAIVEQAIRDYRSYLKKRNRRGQAEVERFFRSEWFNELCDLDGEYIITEVKRKWREDFLK